MSRTARPRSTWGSIGGPATDAAVALAMLKRLRGRAFDAFDRTEERRKQRAQVAVAQLLAAAASDEAVCAR
jgi:hypothetical protein